MQLIRRGVLHKFGIENLHIETVEWPIPTLQKNEILVRMHAAALNYVDLAILEGALNSRLKLPLVPIADGAGVVEKVGSDIRGYSAGDVVSTVYIAPWRAGRYTSDLTDLEIRPGAGRVDGQLCEYKVFRADEIIRMPSHLSPIEASTLPIAGLTAWNALVYGGVKPGKTVLIHGTGGVSIFALQFAKLFGARVIITSSSDKKLEQARMVGADWAINYKTANLVDEVLHVTGGQGADLVVETVGGSNLQQSLDSLRPEGHLSVVGFLSGMAADINLVALNLKRATLTGVSVGSRQDFEDMLAAIAQSSLSPMIGATFPFANAREAFAFLKSGSHFGKVVILLEEGVSMPSRQADG